MLHIYNVSIVPYHSHNIATFNFLLRTISHYMTSNACMYVMLQYTIIILLEYDLHPICFIYYMSLNIYVECGCSHAGNACSKEVDFSSQQYLYMMMILVETSTLISNFVDLFVNLSLSNEIQRMVTKCLY